MAAIDRRLSKELSALLVAPPPNVSVVAGQCEGREWHLKIEGAEDTVYAGETYELQFKFSKDYPFTSPEVVFVGEPPQHPHIYQNGHICLSILYKEWSPALSVATLATSIVSMMSSAMEKVWPEDNDQYMKRWSKTKHGPKKTNWGFHDDKI